MHSMYFQIKEQYPEALLLFHNLNKKGNETYEAYNEDAEFVAKIIGKSASPEENGATLMIEFPQYDLDKYLPKFVRAGKRVVICDSLSEEKAKARISDLNRDEMHIFNECYRNAKSYNEDGGFCIEECDFGGYTKKQISGYFSQLKQKGYIQKVEDCYFSHYINKKHWKEED